MITWRGPKQHDRASLIRMSCGSATNVVFSRKWVLGCRQILVCPRHNVWCLLEAIVFGEECLILFLDRSDGDNNCLHTVLETIKPMEMRGK